MVTFGKRAYTKLIKDCNNADIARGVSLTSIYSQTQIFMRMAKEAHYKYNWKTGKAELVG